jgi:hypothetical protein
MRDEPDQSCSPLRKRRGVRGEVAGTAHPTPNPSPLVGRGETRLYIGLLLLIALFTFACAAKQTRGSLPSEVESAIGTINDEIAAERYDKIYNDASELWRQDATLEESTATFKALRTKLGVVENRTLQAVTEQQNSGGPLKGRAFIVTYRTKFQNGEGMETFTLVERDGRWLLARYFVNSTALK